MIKAHRFAEALMDLPAQHLDILGCQSQDCDSGQMSWASYDLAYVCTWQ